MLIFEAIGEDKEAGGFTAEMSGFPVTENG